MLAHSLRTNRRRSGLSQREAGFLLGMKDGASISRYEQGRRLPPLRTAIAYSAVLDVPVAVLFPDIEREVNTEIARRLPTLRAKLEAAQATKRGSRRAARMAQWLREHHGREKANSLLQ